MIKSELVVVGGLMVDVEQDEKKSQSVNVERLWSLILEQRVYTRISSRNRC